MRENMLKSQHVMIPAEINIIKWNLKIQHVENITPKKTFEHLEDMDITFTILIYYKITTCK